eukprot:TRINITY_DN84985_c0_g1_i1.p1 TRINITY_DN84985_c0_g1~~TRINITY_DN84985_c0_g1_i1.p1  ORF type:complete len:385 (-),score=24.30 TRINITY_DN84985_c0_g1_i1:198-1352(-)
MYSFLFLPFHAMVKICSYVSKWALGFSALMMVCILVHDVVFLVLRMIRPSHQIWESTPMKIWGIAWAFVWTMQLRFWDLAFENKSLMLIQQQIKLVCLIHSISSRLFGECLSELQIPSAGLRAQALAESPDPSLRKILALRCVPPLAHALFNGLPFDWKEAFCIMIFTDIFPPVIGFFLREISLLFGVRLLPFRPTPWDLSYPATCALSADEDCAIHGNCPICLDNLCCPEGGAAASKLMLTMRHRLSATLSVARRCSDTGAASLSAARAGTAMMGGKIATTRCGHRFHSGCLAQACKVLKRCPECRAGLGDVEDGRLPSEDVFQAMLRTHVIGMLTALAVVLCRDWITLMVSAVHDKAGGTWELAKFTMGLAGSLKLLVPMIF